LTGGGEGGGKKEGGNEGTTSFVDAKGERLLDSGASNKNQGQGTKEHQKRKSCSGEERKRED